MADNLVLFGVASDGTVEQWDGLSTPVGILLRWFHDAHLGFPDYGYDLYRAPVPDFRQLRWDQPLGDPLAAHLDGQTNFTLPDGDLALTCGQGFHFMPASNGLALVIPAGERVSVTFNGPAWYVSVTPSANASGGFSIEVLAGGTRKEARRLSPGDPPAEWRTRGIDRLELASDGTGDGGLVVLGYQLLHAPRNWQHLVHLCLPVTDPAYACGPAFPSSDEDEAKRRLPPGVDWASRYGPSFPDLHNYLKALATHTAPPPLPPSTQPNAPALRLDPESAIRLAALDPHIARIIGLAWGDDLSPFGLDGREWAYKVVGHWRGAPWQVTLHSREALAELQAHGISVNVGWQNITPTHRGVEVNLSAGEALTFEFLQPLDALTLQLLTRDVIPWQALDEAGNLLAEDRILAARGPVEQSIGLTGMRTLLLWGEAHFELWALGGVSPPVDRESILPSIAARDLGPPSGPGWITAVPEQPGGTASPLQAALTWEVELSSDSVYRESGPVLNQVAATQVSNDPLASQPAPPNFRRAFLLFNADPILLPTPLPKRYATDRNLSEGWRCYWARGVDLFGRVSAPSAPHVVRLEDSAAPPPPALVLAEYAQADLPLASANLLGRSAAARAWLAAHPSQNAVVAGWAWTPELEAMCPDVDGFRLYVRRPAVVTGGSALDPQTTYQGVAWGPARSAIGPVAVRYAGQVTGAQAGGASITLSAVQPIDDTRSYCLTNLTLDAGAGALIGAELVQGPNHYPIIGNSDGPNISISVSHAGQPPPAPGSYSLEAGTTRLATVQTNIAPASLNNPDCRQVAGALRIGTQRVLVLGRSGGMFICLPESGLPSTGEPVTWYPAYVCAIADTGFGPQASASQPVGRAQVMVTSVRRWSGRQVESPPGSPGGLTAVEATPPIPPTLTSIPSGPYCAELATRADWYGVSRFELKWTATAGQGYIVYRALGEAIHQLDLAAHGKGPAAQAHSFPSSEWPPGMWNDPNRRAVVQADLAALDAALQSNNDDTIAAAYEALHADTQQLIAAQAAVAAAYVARNGEPLKASSFVDELDGLSRAHWFYRVAARSAGGLESAMSPPTPPICCPDVVPPSAPLAQTTLSDDGKVRLRWQASPDSDLARYLIYRTDDGTAAADVRTMSLVARLAPTPASTPGAGEVLPASVSGQPAWLEYADAAPPGREWLYRLVAEDKSGNRSAPSSVLRGRSLKPPPVPPVWNAPVRGTTSVSLSWMHPSDQRLACLVERRATGGAMWASVSGWLPRSVYQFEDTPPDLALEWEYRLKVRDVLGRTASQSPTVTLPALP